MKHTIQVGALIGALLAGALSPVAAQQPQAPQPAPSAQDIETIKRQMQALITADGEAEGSLVATLRAMAEADMNVQLAGRQLGKHANTVYARLERIKTLTGLDGQRYRDLTELLLAADCWRL